jgi:hypothetical protein
MTEACIRQMRKLAVSALELPDETAAREESAGTLEAALREGPGGPRRTREVGIDVVGDG